MIRDAKQEDIDFVKALIESSDEMDADPETFSEEYFKRIIKKGILLVDEEDDEIVGACFGTYKNEEQWADLLGIVVEEKFRNQRRGKALVTAFEEKLSPEIKTIDLYADETNTHLFDSLGYQRRRKYVAYRKHL